MPRKSKQYRKKSMKKGGSCGCQQQTQSSFFSGGGALGPASLINYDPTNTYTYPVNTHNNNDPLDPAKITDSRGLPNLYGGKKKSSKTSRKNRKSRKSRKNRKSRKTGGGDPYLHHYNANPLSNSPTNSISGAFNAAGVIGGKTNDVYSGEVYNNSAPFI
jgi:hypothetical protein